MGEAMRKVMRTNALAGFVVERIVGDVMRAHVKKANIGDKVNAETEDEQLAVALVFHFRETTKEGDLTECPWCLAVSPSDLDRCPICGLLDEEAKAKASEAQKAKVKANAEAAEKAVPTLTESPPIAHAAKPAKDTKTKAPSAKGAKNINTEDGGAKNMAAASNVTSITENKGDDKGGKLTVAVLDKKVGEAIELKSASSISMWQLGKVIAEIIDQNLWKLRQGDDKTPRYKGFDSFCHAELKMSPTHAYNLAGVAREYGEAQVKKFGVSKLGLVLQAPPEDRERIQEQVETGKSKREIAAEVNKARKEKNFKKKTGKGKKHTSSATGRKPEKVSIVKMEGRVSIPLYAKPASLRNLDMKSLKPAKKIGDVPFGRHELPDGLVEYVSVQQNSAGNLVLVKEVRREDATK